MSAPDTCPRCGAPPVNPGRGDFWECGSYRATGRPGGIRQGNQCEAVEAAVVKALRFAQNYLTNDQTTSENIDRCIGLIERDGLLAAMETQL